MIVVSKCDHESRRTDSYMAHYSGCLGIPEKDHFRSRRIFTGISQRRGGPLQAAGTTAPRVRRESKVILIFWAPWLFKTIYALCSQVLLKCLPVIGKHKGRDVLTDYCPDDRKCHKSQAQR